MAIFKTYDIRGVYPSELNPQIAFNIGSAIGTIANGRSVFLNTDNRKGSKAIKKKFTEGLLKTGAHVYDIGMGPIMVSAVASYQNNSYGACLTASHNPSEYTGVITVKNGVTIEPQLIKKLYDSKKFSERKGKLVEYDYSPRYIDFITRNINDLDLDIAIDSMGGSTTFISKDVAKRIGVRPDMIYTKTSETFYGKHPEPKSDNGKEISQLIKKRKLDFGVQFDADGDRAGFYDEKGRFIEPIIAGLLLVKFNNLRRVLANVSCSTVLEKFAKVKYSKVGHTFIERELVRGKYDMAIEQSSHFYFGKYHPFSDGLLAMALFSKAVSETGEKVSAMVEDLPKIYYVEDAIHFKGDEERSKTMSSIAQKIERIKGAKVDRMDGYKVIFDDGFMLFRESGTQPLIRVYYEGEDQKAFDRIKGIVSQVSKQ